MKESEDALVCHRVGTVGDIDPLHSVRTCSICGHDIYVMNKNLQIQILRICWQCMESEAENLSDDDEIEFHSPDKLIKPDSN
jgi:hypothetical protein